MDFKDKKVLIFGLGRYEQGSGISAARFFIKQGAKVTVTDLKKAKDLGKTAKFLETENRKPKTKHKIVFHFGSHQMSDVRAADIILRNPGVPSSSPYLREARRRKIPIYTDVSFFMLLCPCPIIGITGTRGKSTTTALIGEILRRKNKKTFVGGNIQRSPLTFLDKLDKKSLVVLELSSWLLESLADIKKSPQVAVITNIYPDHLNVHGSMREYVRAKENIFQFQKSGDVLVLNHNNKYTRQMGKGKRGVIWFSKKDQPRLKRGVGLKGEHNLANALAAIAVAKQMGVSWKDTQYVLQRFKGLPNRQEIVRVRGGITWVNDTTATTPEAAIAALERFDKNIILIAGGADKKLKFTALTKAIKKHCKAVILLPGTATPKIQIPDPRSQIPVVKSMREAVKLAQKLAKRGDTVLLSPACASFGLFQNEFDRGEQFVKLVTLL